MALCVLTAVTVSAPGVVGRMTECRSMWCAFNSVCRQINVCCGQGDDVLGNGPGW